jgi:hypothetical protein
MSSEIQMTNPQLNNKIQILKQHVLRFCYLILICGFVICHLNFIVRG